ncbi:MAG: DUF3299 domain-containing protein [Pseudomonadota bacterium]
MKNAFATLPARALAAGAALALPALPAALVALAGALLLPAAAQAQARDGVPLMKPPLQGAAPPATTPATPASPAAPRTIQWEALVPPNWDPFKDFKDLNFQLLDDGDPRAVKMLKRMREVWDSAPANPAIEGQSVRIPGFVVPLEDSKEGLKEFLLVPYFGACIHSPPPPANQIIHVLPRTPAKGLRSMDTVWVSGPIRAVRTDSYMGMSGYRIEAVQVAPYEEKRR